MKIYFYWGFKILFRYLHRSKNNKNKIRKINGLLLIQFS